MMHAYFKSLYQRTMRGAYAKAIKEIAAALISGGSGPHQYSGAVGKA